MVGPRSLAVAHNGLYRKVRHKVKLGVTGWAQLNSLRGETDRVEKIEATPPVRPLLPAQLVPASRPVHHREERTRLLGDKRAY